MKTEERRGKEKGRCKGKTSTTVIYFQCLCCVMGGALPREKAEDGGDKRKDDWIGCLSHVGFACVHKLRQLGVEDN